ncbi:MAG: protein of unknown function, DUF3179 [Candidatus Nanosalina sp. J07AB43]|nr:MAG: protein of unknown function, DUF3179 [Candidatus Nanosalina sp. J07AB43]
MQNKNYILLAAGLTGLLVSTGILLATSPVEDSTEGSAPDLQNRSFNTSSEIKMTESGRKYIVRPDELLQGCPGGKDCIPSIDNPQFDSAEEVDWLNPSDKVVGLEVNNESRAYPLKILSRHEIVNDRIGGKPVAVTYCPLCRSAVTHSRKVGNEVLEFGVSGKLYNANLVMYDRSSDTLWSQISGRAIIGEKVPQKLDLVFSSITEWDDWEKAHPDTDVLSIDTGIYPNSVYETEAYSGYKRSERVGYGVNQVDERLPSKDIVYGIKAGNESIAVTKDVLQNEKIIQTRLGNNTLIAFKRPSDGSVNALLQNETGADFSLEDGEISSTAGDKWTLDGKEINGNDDMRRLLTQGFYWFAWSKFNPETQLYR